MNNAIFGILTMLAVGCGTTPKNQLLDMSGAYKMISATTYDGKNDSIAADIEQSKIYTEDYFIYAATHDSTASFAVGTYTNDNGLLTEHVLFSASDTHILQPASYVFNIEKNPQGYSQTINDTGTLQGKVLARVEKYKHVGNGAKCPMDGAWKLLASYAVQNQDTTWDNYTDYKLCDDGYIIWGAVSMDAATKKHKTYIGVSTFEMKGNKGREFCTNSNYFQNKGKTFDMDIEFRDKDEFKQTILDSTTGIKYVEIYQRLNK